MTDPATPSTAAGKALWADWSNMEPEMLDAILAIERQAAADALAAAPAPTGDAGLDAAWQAVEAVLPKGWAITRLAFIHLSSVWYAMAEALVGPGSAQGAGPTPAAALVALRAALQETNR